MEVLGCQRIFLTFGKLDGFQVVVFFFWGGSLVIGEVFYGDVKGEPMLV